MSNFHHPFFLMLPLQFAIQCFGQSAAQIYFISLTRKPRSSSVCAGISIGEIFNEPIQPLLKLFKPRPKQFGR